VLVFIIPMLVEGQNIQLHYDYGDGRNYLTSTIEMFKPDKYGATFFFFDMDYNYQEGDKSASLAYLEIARYINIPLDKLAATIQYNDGIIGENYEWSAPLGPVWLGGISYPLDLGFITLSTDVLIRKSRNSDSPDAQLTIIWNKKFLNDKVTFMGFFDLWSQDKMDEDGKEPVLLTEPQLWYGLNNNLSVGGELEFSKNFVSDDFEIMPTFGFKWQF
jgi:hypothetical protein